MSHTIIVPLSDPLHDQEGVAEQAINCMELFTDSGDTRVVLVSAIDDESLRDARQAYLDHIAGTIGGFVDTVVNVGDATPTILAMASEVDDPVIVMASHGRRGAQLRILGSVAASVAQGARCPVLILPASAITQAPICNLIERVLLPIHDRSIADNVVREALHALGSRRATVIEFHLVGVAASPESQTLGDNAFAQDIRQIVETMQSQGYRATWEVCSGNPAKNIARIAAEKAVNLIIMQALDESGPNTLMFDILAAQVRTAEPVPVLLVHPSTTEDSLQQGATPSAAIGSDDGRTD